MHHRELPWRITPREHARGVRPDPYRIWLSEVMLQQTTVEAVKSYFRVFVEKWPDVEALAAAPTEDVMKAWAGLGYYSRARNLKACADLVAERGGRFPDTEAGLRELPGIGAYTSAAITAIAFDRPAAVVDGNVERVISRLFSITTPLSDAKAEIRAHVERMVPGTRPGDFAQAMMDLGATICTPRRPRCMLCPVREDCSAVVSGDPEHFPVRLPKADKPLRRGAAFVAVRERRRHSSAQTAGKGPARRHDRSADDRLDRTDRRRHHASGGTLSRQLEARGADRACLHPFRARARHLPCPHQRRDAGRPFLVAALGHFGRSVADCHEKGNRGCDTRRDEKTVATQCKEARMTEIRHIVFDIGRVLIHYDPNIPFSRLIPDAEEQKVVLRQCLHA